MLFSKNQVLRYRDLTNSAAVASAIKDLANDFLDVLGITLEKSDSDSADLIFGADAPDEIKDQTEGHAIIEKNGRLEFSGTDERGIMWAIYTFSDEYLGVFPLYFWADQEKPAFESLIFDKNYISEPFRIRFRGWFLNDEDLLTGFKDSGKVRDVDYPYYHTVVSAELIEKVAEAALRSKMNLIIPASLMDIGNPDERVLVDVCAARGLYVTQHHIEPLGVSGFTWDSYWKKRGNEIPEQSYIKNPDKYEEIWRYYASLWAKYPNVIWQLGLRGRGDKPVWTLDPSIPKDNESRGGLITKAIMTEYRIVSETLGRNDFISTSTLWAEGENLMAEGCLQFPEDTIIVYSDRGDTQCFGGDLDRCENDFPKGIYYHAAFFSGGPHLARGNPPERMERNILYALRKGCEDYAILNVSNVREFVENINFFTALTISGEKAKRSEIVRKYAKRVFGNESYEEICESFYGIYEKLPDENLMIDGHIMNCARRTAEYLTAGDMTACPPDIYKIANSRELPVIAEKHREILERQIKRVKDFLSEEKPAVEEKYARFQRSQFVYQPEIILHLCEWALEIFRFAESGDSLNIEAALGHIDALRGTLKENAYPNKVGYLCDWSNWYRECVKISPDKLETWTRRIIKK